MRRCNCTLYFSVVIVTFPRNISTLKANLNQQDLTQTDFSCCSSIDEQLVLHMSHSQRASIKTVAENLFFKCNQ